MFDVWGIDYVCLLQWVWIIIQQRMLKTFKLHTINLSHQIFNSENQNSEPIAPISKLPPSYNKRFKYGYNRCKNNANFNKKTNRHTIDTQQIHNKQEFGKEIIEPIVSIASEEEKQKSNKRRSAMSSPHKHIANFINHDSKKKNMPGSGSRQAVHQGQRTKNKTERTQKYHANSHESAIKQREHSDFQLASDFPEQMNTVDSKQRSVPKQNNSLRIIKEHQLVQHQNVSGMIKSRTIPKNKYFNSIINSYKIKSIELANPLENRNRRFSSSHAIPNVPSYYIDLANQDNLQQIYFEDIQKIQLQKLKFDHHRTYSNHNNKKRPLTSKIPSKIEDFKPMPWQSEDKPEEIFAKDTPEI